MEGEDYGAGWFSLIVVLFLLTIVFHYFVR